MTSNQVATIDEQSTAIEVLPAAQPPSLVARQMLQAHAEMMDTAYELAFKMCKTDLVPRRFKNKSEDGCAAILYGAELGLNPIQSLQRVVPIHGMPTLESRTMVALLKARGYRFRWVEKSDTTCTFEGWSPDGEDHELSTWTIDDAKRRGYVPTPSSDDSLCRPDVDGDWVTVTKTWDGKSKTSVVGNMKYITDPKAMLKAKCQAEVCRDLAPDILLGISYATDEFDDDGPAPSAPAPAAAPAAEPITVEEILDPQPAAPPQPQPEPKSPAANAGAAAAAAAADAEADAPKLDQKKVRNVFALLKKVAVTEKDDRLILFRKLTGRTEIGSTNDLTPGELDRVLNALKQADADGTLDDKVRDALNEATIAAENARTQAAEPQPIVGDASDAGYDNDEGGDQ